MPPYILAVSICNTLEKIRETEWHVQGLGCTERKGCLRTGNWICWAAFRILSVPLCFITFTQNAEKDAVLVLQGGPARQCQGVPHTPRSCWISKVMKPYNHCESRTSPSLPSPLSHLFSKYLLNILYYAGHDTRLQGKQTRQDSNTGRAYDSRTYDR